MSTCTGYDEGRVVTVEETVAYASCEVFDRGLSALRGKAADLNKRAKRHGMNTLDVRIVGVKGFVPIHRPLQRLSAVSDIPMGSVQRDGVTPIIRFGCTEPLYCVEIHGSAPRIDGWALAARVEFNGVIGQVVRIAPGRDDDGSYSQYRNIEPICEHCNSRRNRKDVFVLEDREGRRKVVGRNCLADFLRCASADDFARLAEYADQAREWADRAEAEDSDYYGGEWAPTAVSLERLLPVVSVLMRRIGWTSRTSAREDCELDGRLATADLAVRVLFPSSRWDKEFIVENELYPNEKDEALAACAVKWASEVDASGNEYLSVVKRIAIAGETDLHSLLGYAASIIIAYRKACEREALAAERAKTTKDKVYIGEAKERVRNLKVVCKGTHCIEGHYGVTTIVRFEHSVNADEKAVLVWFASGDREQDWDEGATYVVDATVKGHDDHERYGKQTKINRVKAKSA